MNKLDPLGTFQWPELFQKYFPNQEPEHISNWPKKLVEEYHQKAIEFTLKHAYNNNTYYQEQFKNHNVTPEDFTNLDDLEKFPFLQKDALRGNPWLLLSVPKKEISHIHMSTGTTSQSIGDHIYQLHTWEEFYTISKYIKPNTSANIDPGDIVIIALPYEMSSAGISLHRVHENSTNSIVVNTGKGGFYSDPLKTIIIMKDLKADVILTTPSYAMYLSEIAEENGINIIKDIGLKKMWITGEGCSNSYRDRLQNIWNCKVFRNYGSLECGPLGVECDEQNGFHIYESFIHMEVINPQTGDILPPGNIGELVVTSLNRVGAPLIRYRVQDKVFIETAPCPCGRKTARLFLRGRIQDQLAVAGQSFSPFQAEDLLYKIPEMGNSHQFIFTKSGLTLRIELKCGIENTPELRDKIKCQMEYILGEIHKIEVVDKIPRTGGKTVRIIREEN
ncbi:MAG: phenylacetate--CoA ligase family protein [Spirochaetes bacterium]|jgi:phenylacetate-CoA ligase|nr:phenylacetate--CoA ligase family protein [Spirochaetota bacterium]